MSEHSIVLVEDNPDEVALIIRAFAKNNRRNPVILAEDGQHALDLVLPAEGQRPIEPSLVLLDLPPRRVSSSLTRGTFD